MGLRYHVEGRLEFACGLGIAGAVGGVESGAVGVPSVGGSLELLKDLALLVVGIAVVGVELDRLSKAFECGFELVKLLEFQCPGVVQEGIAWRLLEHGIEANEPWRGRRLGLHGRMVGEVHLGGEWEGVSRKGGRETGREVTRCFRVE